MTAFDARPDAVQEILDAVPLALAVFDVDQRLVRANRLFADLTDAGDAAVTGRALHDAWPNALADLESQIAAVRRSGRPETRLIEYRGPNGTRTAEVTIARLASAEGGWVFVGLDVAEREELRRSLARSVKELETIFATIPESIRVFGPTGELVRYNVHARDAHHEQTPMSVAALWQADRPRAPDGNALFLHEHPAARALAGESVRGQPLVLRRDDQDATVDVNAEPLRDESGRLRGAVTVDRDVTEHVRLAQQLAEQVRERESQAARLEQLVEERSRQLLALQADRERERRLAAVGQLAAGVMHDVNNVLNPILAAAYLIEAYATDEAAVKEYAQRVARAAQMGVARLARLRQFIRQEPSPDAVDELVELSQAVDDTLALAAPLWQGRGASDAVRIERDLALGVVVRGAAADLRAATLNLVQNALDAMPQGGTLTVLVAVRDASAVVEIRDTGTGMTPDVLERAFEPFFSTKGSRGTGLGLAEVYGIVKRHRGVAEIDSTPGAGTVVRLRFPLATTVE